jgi:hypothetical protein
VSDVKPVSKETLEQKEMNFFKGAMNVVYHLSLLVIALAFLSEFRELNKKLERLHTQVLDARIAIDGVDHSLDAIEKDISQSAAKYVGPYNYRR